MLRISAFLIGSVALAGCGGGGGGGAHEPDLTAYAGPITSADTARGEEVYNEVCSGCHSGGAPEIPGIGWEPARMRHQIRNGEGRMPAIDETRVSADDLEALLAYLTTNGAVTGELPAGGDAPVDAADAPAEEPTEEGDL
jgi:mono/diheme cytochrome c family protein